MPALFIDVKLTAESAADPGLAKKLEEVCPVGIFLATDAGVETVEANLDECVLCDLCIQAAPEGAVQVVKLYQS